MWLSLANEMLADIIPRKAWQNHWVFLLVLTHVTLKFKILYIPVRIPLKVISTWCKFHEVQHHSESPFKLSCAYHICSLPWASKPRTSPRSVAEWRSRVSQFIYCKTNPNHKTDIVPLTFLQNCIISLGKWFYLIKRKTKFKHSVVKKWLLCYHHENVQSSVLEDRDSWRWTNHSSQEHVASSQLPGFNQVQWRTAKRLRWPPWIHEQVTTVAWHWGSVVVCYAALLKQ